MRVCIYVPQLKCYMWLSKRNCVWSQQSDFDKLWVCGLIFPRHRKACGWLVWMVTKQQGVPGNSMPLGALQTFPLVSAGPMLSSFSQLKYRPRFWSQEYNFLLLTEFFCKTLVLQLAGCVTGRVKIIILCRWIYSIIRIQQTWSCPQEKLHCQFLLITFSPHLPSFLCAYNSLLAYSSNTLLSHATVVYSHTAHGLQVV